MLVIQEFRLLGDTIGTGFGSLVFFVIDCGLEAAFSEFARLWR